MRTHKICKWLFLSAFAAFVTAGCTDADEYKQFLEGGEIQYTGQIESAQALAGDGRIAISGVFGSDPKVVNCRIYWNLRADWIDVPVDLTASKSLYKVIELPENSYSFEIITYDDLDNASIPVTTMGTSYGKRYKASISNRLNTTDEEDDEQNPGNINAIISWRAIDTSTGAYESEVTYTDADDVQHTVKVPVADKTTVLTNYKSGSDISHKTFFKPEAKCLDVFVSPSSTYIAKAPLSELKELDKKLFANKSLPGDATPAAGVLGAEKMWDGITQENWTQRYVSAQNAAPAQWVTFDTGQKSKLTGFKLWNYGDDSTPGVPRMHYSGFHMQHFQIWGSMEPSDDGSWESWKLLGDFTVEKPSGLPVGQETEEDRAKGVAGFDFVFPADQPKVRYIRIKNLGNWGGTYGMDIEEISLTGWVY